MFKIYHYAYLKTANLLNLRVAQEKHFGFFVLFFFKKNILKEYIFLSEVNLIG